VSLLSQKTLNSIEKNLEKAGVGSKDIKHNIVRCNKEEPLTV